MDARMTHTGRLRELGRDGVGLIVQETPDVCVFNLTMSMLSLNDPEVFVSKEGETVQFEIGEGGVRNIRFVKSANI